MANFKSKLLNNATGQEISQSVYLPGLISGGWRDLLFRPFRDGVDIIEIKTGMPAVAVLRYQPKASIPYHMHRGLETIIILEGVQSDEFGDYPTGSVILNPEGTKHSVWSTEGCVVLIHWQKPVRFMELPE